MKKVIFLVVATIFLNGCFQVIAMVGPAATGVASGNVYQSAISYTLSYGVKKTTGKTIIENVIDLNKGSKSKEKIAKNKVNNKDIVNSFRPRTYPGTYKTTYIF